MDVFLYVKFSDVEMAEVEMTIVQKLKSITVPILCNILLPVFDVFSDARIIIILFLGSHPNFALMLLLPFLLNYIVSFLTWWRNDTNKKTSFIFALLNFYAPYGKFFFREGEVMQCFLFNHFRSVESCMDASEESKGGAKNEEKI